MRMVADLDELAALVDDHPEVFVRYSRGPDDDAAHPSRDYEAGLEMPGLSVTPLRPEPWWTKPAIEWIARRVCKYMDLADSKPDRRPWVLTGKVVGYGPDHEPLVGEVQPLAWISADALEQARHCYRACFHVGRDSTG